MRTAKKMIGTKKNDFSGDRMPMDNDVDEEEEKNTITAAVETYVEETMLKM